jgi:MOSC domain-containing protein YiiM
MNAPYRTREELDAGLDEVRRSPADAGRLELIVRRPRAGEREVVSQGQLDLVEGLVGDNWLTRGSRHTSDGRALPDAQVTVMSSRAVALMAGAKERWPLAGDQLYVDLDLSVDNLPSGTQLAIGSAVIEVTAQPHTGCKLFSQRFGPEATRFANSPLGSQLRLRGINARVVQGGAIRVGDLATKLERRGE